VERGVIYRTFLAAVLAPQVAASAALLGARLAAGGPGRRRELRRGLVLTGVLVVVAVGYTLPWDRWLIVHAVWSYPAGSVLGTVAQIPVEEYLFMIGQTLMIGMWSLVVVSAAGALSDSGAVSDADAVSDTGAARHTRRRALCGAAWLAAAAAGVAFAATGRGFYLGAILVWYAPPLALQAAVGADALRRARGTRLAALAPTALLWVSDAVAIHEGAWRIGAAHTLGFAVFGLPLEEAVFYLLTNLLVVDSVILLADGRVHARLARRLRRVRPRAAGPQREAIGICEQSKGLPRT
jgi:lycopene cyclase domain-containing protein